MCGDEFAEAEQIVVGFDESPLAEPAEDTFNAALADLARCELCRIASIAMGLCHRYGPLVAASYLVYEISGRPVGDTLCREIAERLRRRPLAAHEIAVRLHAQCPRVVV